MQRRILAGCLLYFAVGDYDKVWNDVHKIESFGYTIPEDFLITFAQIFQRIVIQNKIYLVYKINIRRNIFISIFQ